MMVKMSPMERVLTALSHKEPDRVPLFLLFSLYGAKFIGSSIKDYFNSPQLVAKTQGKLQKEFNNDCLYNFYYAAIEMEAFGGEAIFQEDGPPNSGEPLLKDINSIKSFECPRIEESKKLLNVLETTRLLRRDYGDTVPIIGVVMSPFSLPVMQMGFDKYIDLIYEHRDLFASLMQVNEEFTISWANAQLKAGATAICYFDPVSSPSIIPRELYLETGYQVAKRTLSRINGPTATHMASGRVLPIIDDIVQTGTAAVGVSSLEDIAQVKNKIAHRIAILGNLNGIEMCNWTGEDGEKHVKDIIFKGAPGGGLIISDNHGEIPFNVKEDTLHTISESVEKWGRYPINKKS